MALAARRAALARAKARVERILRAHGVELDPVNVGRTASSGFSCGGACCLAPVTPRISELRRIARVS